MVKPFSDPVRTPRKNESMARGSGEKMAGETILLIDDDEIVRDVTTELLAALGYQLLVAENAAQALAIAKSSKPIAVALLDIYLPDMSGKELFPLLLAAQPQLRVIICSGYALDETVNGLLAQGAKGFLQKPFRLSVLQEKIEEALAAR